MWKVSLRLWLDLFHQFRAAPKSLFSRCSWQWSALLCCTCLHFFVRVCVWHVSGRPCAPLVTLLPETRGEGEEKVHQSLWKHAPSPSLCRCAVLSLYSSSQWPVTALHKTHSASKNNKHIATCSAVLLVLFPFPSDCWQNIFCLHFNKYLYERAVMGEDEAREPEKNRILEWVYFPVWQKF